MTPVVVVAGPDLAQLMELTLDLGRSVGSPTFVVTPRPVDDLTRRPLRDGDFALVLLNGTENIGDLLEMFRANPEAGFLLLSESYPPRAAVARVVHEHHASVLPADESSMVIAATLIALQSRRRALVVQ